MECLSSELSARFGRDARRPHCQVSNNWGNSYRLIQKGREGTCNGKDNRKTRIQILVEINSALCPQDYIRIHKLIFYTSNLYSFFPHVL